MFSPIHKDMASQNTSPGCVFLFTIAENDTYSSQHSVAGFHAECATWLNELDVRDKKEFNPQRQMQTRDKCQNPKGCNGTSFEVTTKQMRSADEGSTNFIRCLKCNYTHREN